jgi:hypothetical protein
MARNPAAGPGARSSLRPDFSDIDRANPDELNEILWGGAEARCTHAGLRFTANLLGSFTPAKSVSLGTGMSLTSGVPDTIATRKDPFDIGIPGVRPLPCMRSTR